MKTAATVVTCRLVYLNNALLGRCTPLDVRLSLCPFISILSGLSLHIWPGDFLTETVERRCRSIKRLNSTTDGADQKFSQGTEKRVQALPS